MKLGNYPDSDKAGSAERDARGGDYAQKEYRESSDRAMKPPKSEERHPPQEDVPRAAPRSASEPLRG